MFSIPQQLEADIFSGKAKYRTHQTGVGGQSVLKNPDNSFLVLFGYDFSPAGGGIMYVDEIGSPNRSYTLPEQLRPFETQQLSFYSAGNFHTFLHHVDITHNAYVKQFDPVTGATSAAKVVHSIDNSKMSQSMYLVTNTDISVMVGLVKQFQSYQQRRIDNTPKTPSGLSFGDDGNQHHVSTQLNSTIANNFYQPSVEKGDYYGNGLIPGFREQDQLYVQPEFNSAVTGDGLIDPSDYIVQEFNDLYTNYASIHYTLTLHYALYNELPK